MEDPVVSVELLVELFGVTKEKLWCEYMPYCFSLVKDTHHLEKNLWMIQLPQLNYQWCLLERLKRESGVNSCPTVLP